MESYALTSAMMSLAFSGWPMILENCAVPVVASKITFIQKKLDPAEFSWLAFNLAKIKFKKRLFLINSRDSAEIS